jgi:hypothetical protein
MSTMGPLCPEQLTQETLKEVCVGPITDISSGGHPVKTRLALPPDPS